MTKPPPPSHSRRIQRTRQTHFNSHSLSSPSPSSPNNPQLTFSPAAWLKWQFLCHAGPTEVAGFGLSSPENPLYLDDVLLLRQRATVATVEFDDHAVADLFDQLTDQKIPPSRFARIWLHTHPGSSVTPSGVDEETFGRCFGGCDWAVMGILGRTGRTYARLRFRAGPGTAMDIPTRVDWGRWPELMPEWSWCLAEWQHEYDTLVEAVEFRIGEWFGSAPMNSSPPAHSPSALAIPPTPGSFASSAGMPEFDFFHPHVDPFLPPSGEHHVLD